MGKQVSQAVAESAAHKGEKKGRKWKSQLWEYNAAGCSSDYRVGTGFHLRIIVPGESEMRETVFRWVADA